MSSYGNSGHKGSLTLENSSGRAQDHWHHSWPIEDNVQKPALALVSLGFFSNSTKIANDVSNTSYTVKS
jgi:hypothetical protein